MEINFDVLGKPFGKQRPKFSRRGRFTTTYTPQETINYENYVKYQCQATMEEAKFNGWFNGEPLEMTIYAMYDIPDSYSKKKRQEIEDGKLRPTKKPDVDNIFKAIADGLNGVAYKDDSQIVVGTIWKLYAESPRVVVKIGDINNKKEEI